MIAKGTTHDSGGRLAVYMVKGKPGERAELWQLRGFASDDIKEAFRSIHVMAEGTRCERPFFHVQVRNPEDENLTPAQWERVADRVESKLGLSDQPRAIAFHRDTATGHEHMHVAWSRIDDETMTAKTLPFFKLRLKEVSRELETELGLRPVRNHRETEVMAPTRDEEEQARRLNVEVRDVRQAIRDNWERSDNGHSFRAALAQDGMTLAKGDRRDFVVIDQQGGMHALGKRILGNTAGEVRVRMADLDRAELPTIEEAREQNTRARVASPQPEAPMPTKVKEPEREIDDPVADEIRLAYRQAANATAFAKSLDRNGIRLAVVNAAEAERSRGEYRQGAIVAVAQTGLVYQLDQNTTGDAPGKVETFLAPLDRGALYGIEETQRQIHLEVSRHIELTQVGLLPLPVTEIQPTADVEQRIDFERMLTDRDYRRQFEQQRDRERRAAVERTPQQTQPRSRGLDRS